MKNRGRFEVHTIADASHDSLTEGVIGAFDTIGEARLCAVNTDSSFGVGILDTETNLIDFGRGFGVTGKDETPEDDEPVGLDS